jgi:hypothetical protein
MPIERTSTGATVITGEGITMFAALSMKHRLTLEIKGLKFRKPTAPGVRLLIGSSTRSKKKLLEELNDWIKTEFPVPMVD